MSKKRLYVYIAIVIIVTIIYSFKISSINRNVNEKQFSFDIPKIPLIKKYIPKSDSIGRLDVWNTKQTSIGLVSGKISKNLPQGGYAYKKVDGIDIIYSLSDDKYRWEFYGISCKDNSTAAVFYNPELKLMKVVQKNKQLDNGLIIKKIGRNEVNVKYKNGVFNLKIFDFSKGEKQ